MLAAGVFLAGFAVGLLTRRRTVAAITVIAVALLLAAGLLAGARAPARQIGPIVTQEAMRVAVAWVLALLGGFLAGVIKQRATLLTTVGVALLVAGAVGGILQSAFAKHPEVIRVAKQLGLDQKTAKYEPEKNKACPENLKSLYIAFSMYAEDYGALPPAANWMQNEDLTSKVRQNEWLHCPAVSNRHDDKYGYAYNDQVAGRKLNGKPLKEMPDAAATPLLYDSTNLAPSAHDAVTSLPHPGRHGGRNNILYCDGRVEAVAPK